MLFGVYAVIGSHGRHKAAEWFGQNEKDEYKRGNQNGDGYLSLSVADLRDVLGGGQHGLPPSVPLEDRDQNDVQNETGQERNVHEHDLAQHVDTREHRSVVFEERRPVQFVPRDVRRGVGHHHSVH